jgi:hypothetical protein
MEYNKKMKMKMKGFDLGPVSLTVPYILNCGILHLVVGYTGTSVSGICRRLLKIVDTLVGHSMWHHIPGDSNLHGHCLENFKVGHIFIMISYNKTSVHISALLHYEISVQVLSAYLCQKFQIILILSTFFCHEISVYILPISLHHEVSSYFTW